MHVLFKSQTLGAVVSFLVAAKVWRARRADTEPTSEPRDPAVFGATILLHDSGSTDNYSSNSLCRPDRGSGKKTNQASHFQQLGLMIGKGKERGTEI